jgi:pyridoxamine 5'-phosphate oxidase
MNFEHCTAFARKNPVCYIATMDRDQPRVRAFTLWFADATGFYFHTIAHKDVVAQLLVNPNVEICFTAPPRPPDPVEMMRVSGQMEIVYDPVLMEKLIAERPFLTRMGITGPDDPSLAVLRIPHGDVRIWKMENFLMGKESASISF